MNNYEDQTYIDVDQNFEMRGDFRPLNRQEHRGHRRNEINKVRKAMGLKPLT